MKTISDILDAYFVQAKVVNAAWEDYYKNPTEYKPYEIKFQDVKDMLFSYAKEKYLHFTDKQINEIESFCHEFYHDNYEEYILQFGRMCDFVHGFLLIK